VLEPRFSVLPVFAQVPQSRSGVNERLPLLLQESADYHELPECGSLSSAPFLSGTAALYGLKDGLAAPGVHLRSAFSAPPTGFCPAGSLTIFRQIPAGPPNKALRLSWELPRLLGAPREKRGRKRNRVCIGVA
jgi:hypothetical protein